MVLKELKIERYQLDNKNGTYFFGVRIKDGKEKEFVYLTTSIKDKINLEEWKNNFYAGYKKSEKENIENITLLSTEGITFFDKDWENRQDIKLLRTEEAYYNLEELVKRKDLETLERILGDFKEKYYTFHVLKNL